MDLVVSVGANIYRGYDLETVFENLSKMGVRYVDIDFIKTVTGFGKKSELTHLTEEDLGRAEEIKVLMDKYNLESVTFSGHVDLSLKEDVDLFLKKMEFAKALGVKYISTNAGPLVREKEFLENIDVVERKARELDVIVCLETEMPGDIIQKGEDGVKILQRINSPYVKMTYDFGNTYYASRGEVNLVEDFESSLDFIGNLHFKDAILENGTYRYCTIGEGIIEYRKIADVLKKHGRTFPITIEIPYYFESVNWSPFKMTDEKRDLGEINEMVKKSMEFIESILK